MFQIKTYSFEFRGILNPIFHSNYKINSDLSEESVAIYDVEKVIDYSSEIKTHSR
jgi:hypothetical protein